MAPVKALSEYERRGRVEMTGGSGGRTGVLDDFGSATGGLSLSLEALVKG